MKMIWYNQKSAGMNLVCFQAVPAFNFPYIILNAVIIICNILCRNAPETVSRAYLDTGIRFADLLLFLGSIISEKQVFSCQKKAAQKG